jgi:HSP20 family molecular chaperone IbpA
MSLTPFSSFNRMPTGWDDMDTFDSMPMTQFGTPSFGGMNMNQMVPMLGNETALQRKTNREMNAFAPILNADFFETETDFHVHVDLPGVRQGDVEVDILPTSLVIKAERKHEKHKDNVTLSRHERTYGKVQRTIPLPLGADCTTASAKFRDGGIYIYIYIYLLIFI